MHVMQLQASFHPDDIISLQQALPNPKHLRSHCCSLTPALDLLRPHPYTQQSAVRCTR